MELDWDQAFELRRAVDDAFDELWPESVLVHRPWTDVRALLDRSGDRGCTRSDVARLFGASATMRTEWATAGDALRDLLRSGLYEAVDVQQGGRVVRRYRRRPDAVDAP